MVAMLVAMLGVLGCSGDGKDRGGSTGGTDSTGGGTEVEPICEQPAEVSCQDEMILDLSLHDDKVSDGAVETAEDGADFVTTVDASGGGYDRYTQEPWVYIRFTETGAERVDIDDETAFESMDWDMSLRRFIVRLNGGSSGPSCVGAAPLIRQNYADISEVPDGIPYAVDAYYTEDCTIINDSSGLPGSPQVSMSGWWEYPGCVKTTMTPFLIQRADGKVLKLVVESYYGENQLECNENDSTREPGGFYILRWRFL